METVPLKDICLNTSKFQFRAVDFYEDRVQWLIDNWNPSMLDPLDCWEHPSTQKKYLISGHHRREAMSRMDITECVCRVHRFNLEEAQVFALKSNSTRISYTTFEICRGVCFLVDQQLQGVDQPTKQQVIAAVTKAADELALHPGLARKYYSCRLLLDTDWERQCEPMNLMVKCFRIGMFCEQFPIARSELQSLFNVMVENDMTTTQLEQLLRDVKRKQRDNKSKGKKGEGTLFDLASFTSKTVTTVKERSILNRWATRITFMYDLLTEESNYRFPDSVKEPMLVQLRLFYGYCVGSDDPNIVPEKAVKGRELRVKLDDKVS